MRCFICCFTAWIPESSTKKSLTSLINFRKFTKEPSRWRLTKREQKVSMYAIILNPTYIHHTAHTRSSQINKRIVLLDKTHSRRTHIRSLSCTRHTHACHTSSESFCVQRAASAHATETAIETKIGKRDNLDGCRSSFVRAQ